MTTTTHEIDDLMNMMLENLAAESKDYNDNGSYDLSYTDQLTDSLFYDKDEDTYILVTSFADTFDQDEEEEGEDYIHPDTFAECYREDNDIPSTHSNYTLKRSLIQNNGKGFSRDLYYNFGVGVVYYTR